MAKKGFEVSGRMTVDKFENLFLQSFGVYCDILTEDKKLAKQTDTLAVLRPEDFKGPKKIDFSLTANMLVENVIKKFEANFGISLQIYEVSKASNKSTLAALRREVILEVNDDGIQARKLEMEETAETEALPVEDSEEISEVIEDEVEVSAIKIDDLEQIQDAEDNFYPPA